MSSSGLVPPAVSLSDVRGSQAAEKLGKLKNTDAGNAATIQKSARESKPSCFHWLSRQNSLCLRSRVKSGPHADPGRDQFHAIAMQAVGTALRKSWRSGNRCHSRQAPRGSGGPQGFH